MRILSIETSCDETAIAIAEFSPHLFSAKKPVREAQPKKGAGFGGSKSKPSITVLSNIISSQVKLHAQYGGVVPHLAKREHQKNLVPILLKALKEAALLQMANSKSRIGKRNLQPTTYKLQTILEREPELLNQFIKKVLPLKAPGIDAIAVTHGPGLAPALWVGVNFAKALALFWNKPLIPVNHMAGHLYSSLLQIANRKSLIAKRKNLQPTTYNLQTIKFPTLALLVSGGHTELVLMKGHEKFKVIGETLDDAAGEAFDKVARILGLGYPGGPAISALAEIANNQLSLINNQIKLPRPMLNSKDYNFSFSGLKTAVLYLVRDIPKNKIKLLRPAIAKEFQDAAIEVLVKKTIRAAQEYKVKTILLGGGVAANKLLREQLGHEICTQIPNTKYFIPNTRLTGDNALMIALAAFFTGKQKSLDKVEAEANLRLN